MPSKEQRMKRLEVRFHSLNDALKGIWVVLNKGTQLAKDFGQRQRGCMAFLVRQEQTVLLLQLSNAVRRYDKAQWKSWFCHSPCKQSGKMCG